MMKTEEPEVFEKLSLEVIDCMYHCMNRQLDCSDCICDQVAPDFPMCMLIASMLKQVANGTITVEMEGIANEN